MSDSMHPSPLTKSTQPQVVSLSAAATISCDQLYASTVQKLGTADISIYIQAGYVKGGQFIPLRPHFKLPITPRKLSEFFSGDAKEALITIEYTVGLYGFNSVDSMTLTQFVMQTLDIWERHYGYLSPYSEDGKKGRQDIEAAMNVLKATYSIRELLPADINETQFKEYFAADINISTEGSGLTITEV